MNGKGDYMETLVSVIMPTYNVAPYIEEAVNSILNQTYSNIELIIVDDCSTDGTYNILTELSNKDSRIVLYRNSENKKICATLNKAFSLSKGEYIVRMDGDDISTSDRVQVLVDYMRYHPEIDLSGSQVISINEKGDVISLKQYLRYPEYIKKGNRVSPAVSHIWIAKRLVYDTLRGYRNVPYAEDYDFLLRGEKHGFKYANVENYLYKVRIREGNTGTTNGLKQRKAKEYVRHINSSKDDSSYQLNYQDAIACTKKEIVRYERASKHLNIAINSRKKPLKLVLFTILSMLESRYIFKYIVEAIELRLLVRKENKRYPRSIVSIQ